MYWLYLLELSRTKITAHITNLFPKNLENLSSKRTSLDLKTRYNIHFHV